MQRIIVNKSLNGIHTKISYIALGLKKEKDTWVCPEDGFFQVSRLVRNLDGRPSLLEAIIKYLRDSLCARKMALYVTSYRRRKEVVEHVSCILWKDTSKSEPSGYDQ